MWDVLKLVTQGDFWKRKQKIEESRKLYKDKQVVNIVWEKEL